MEFLGLCWLPHLEAELRGHTPLLPYYLASPHSVTFVENRLKVYMLPPGALLCMPVTLCLQLSLTQRQKHFSPEAKVPCAPPMVSACWREHVSTGAQPVHF